MTAVNKVLFNNAQSLSTVEKALARSNIDASKVAVANAPTITDTEAVSGTALVRDLAKITPTRKSLLLITVYTSVTLDDISTPADLQIEVAAPNAFKLGGVEGDRSLSNASCGYAETSVTVLRKFSSFYAVLAANQTLTIKGTFQSTIAGFQVSYSLNYAQLALE